MADSPDAHKKSQTQNDALLDEIKQLRLRVRELEQAAADKSIGRDFLANMSHEMRTPLNGILGMTDLLLRTPLNTEQRSYLNAVRHSGRDLHKIINNLILFADTRNGILNLYERNFSLKSTLEPLFALIYERAADKNVQFSFASDPDVPDKLIGDADRLRQIMLNLLDNAVKFTSKGNITVNISAWRDPEGRSLYAANVGPDMKQFFMLMITIKDTGDGIPEGKLETIFKPFGIGEQTLTKKRAGAGLGLSVAKQLAEKMGGDVTCRSSEGRGSVFTVTLLFKRQEEIPAVETTDVETGPDIRRILIVDDDPVSLMYAKILLDKAGKKVTTAENGIQALEILEKQAFDAVLMDIQMPELDGISVTRIIRGLAPGPKVTDPNVPVVAMTVFTLSNIKEDAEAAGMDRIVTKPIDGVRLLRALEKAAEKRSK